ncbi:hypothetical protein [Thalassospira tepidiphila]
MNSANDVAFDVAFEANQNVLCTMRASPVPAWDDTLNANDTDYQQQ